MVVVAQPNERHANRTASVLTETQSVQNLNQTKQQQAHILVITEILINGLNIHNLQYTCNIISA